MNSINIAFLHTDSREVVEHIVGIGGTGLVIQRGQYAFKIPRLRREVKMIDRQGMIGRLTPEPGDYDDRQIMIQYIEDEKAIYRRFGECPGILPCYDLDSPNHSIQMKLMKNGDLRHYLGTMRLDRHTQLSWLMDLARILVYIHDRRVVVCDIRSDNILLDDNLSVKMADFGESVMMPLDWNMQGVVDLGYSVSTDIGSFGAVMFEIVTGTHCTFNPLQNWNQAGDPYEWPSRDSLPATDDVWLGHIIDRCWTEGSFTSAEGLMAALELEQVREDEAI